MHHSLFPFKFELRRRKLLVFVLVLSFALLFVQLTSKWSDLCVAEERVSMRAIENSKIIVDKVVMSSENELVKIFDILENFETCPSGDCYPGAKPLFIDIAKKMNLKSEDDLYFMKYAPPASEWPQGILVMLYENGRLVRITADREMDGLSYIMATNLKSESPQAMIWDEPDETNVSNYRVAVPVAINSKTIGAVVVVSNELKNNKYLISTMCSAI